MLETKHINDLVIELWKTCPVADRPKLAPMVYPRLHKNALLFVGFNPAFGKKWSFLKETSYKSIRPQDFFKWNAGKFDVETAREIEAIAKKEYRYFSTFKSMAAYLGLQDEHVDLFFERGTNQKEAARHLYPKRVLSKFAKQQLEISRKLIKDLSPYAIVVANAMGSEIFKEEFDLSFNDDWGTYSFRTDKKEVPVFLTSMLSGQRALDRFSMERLNWHIRWLLKKISPAT